MPRYRYRAYDGSGTLRAGELWVESRQDALQALARKSEVAIELEEAPDAGALPWWQREIGGGSKLSSSALTDFLRELSGLIAANLPIDEALRIMAVQPAIKPSLRKLVADLLDRVTSGAALSEAMSAHQGAFPPFVTRLIHAGEISGNLDGILADLSRYYEQANARASKLAAQLLYPAVLIAAAIIALTVIATVLVPALKPLFEDAGSAPPPLISALSWITETLATYGVPITAGILFCGIAAVLLWLSPSGRMAFDQQILSLPFFGAIIQQSETARLSRTLAALIRNGVPLTEALRISSGVLSNRFLSAIVSNIVRDIEQGRTLSTELQRSGEFPDLFPRLTRVGEETGQLENMLVKVAEAYERSCETRLEKFMTLLTPVLTVVIGGFVGFLVISVMNAILSANTLVLQ
jgi:general secretion pathway protein F